MTLNLVAKAFNVRKNEGAKVLLVALLGFLWSLANSIGVRYADAYFLIHVGAVHLPLVYIAPALAMIVPSVVLLKLSQLFNPKQIYFYSLAYVACFYIILLTLIFITNIEFSPWMWFFYRVFTYQIEAVLMMGYWTFSEQYFYMQDEKRLFVLFSSSVFLGNAATGLMMSSGQFNLITLIAIVLFLLFCTRTLTSYIDKRFHILHEDEQEEELPKNSWNPLSLLQGIGKSRLALLIMLINFCSFLMWVSAEYNYFSFFEQLFEATSEGIAPLQEEKAPLTLFLGKILTLVSLSNLFFGFFLYSRFARLFGITLLLFISPAIMFGAFAGWLLYPTLFFPIMAYFVVEGSLDIIDDCNFNLLLNAIPKNIKYKVRVVVEAFLEPMGMLCAGVLLNLFASLGLFITFAISAAVLSIAYFIKKNYHTAIYENLARNGTSFHKSLSVWVRSFNNSSSAVLFTKLLHGHPKKKRNIFRLLLSLFPVPAEKITQACENLDDTEKTLLFIEAQEAVYLSDPHFIRFSKKHLHSKYQPLSTQCSWYLAANGKLERDEVETLLQAKAPLIQAIAVAGVISGSSMIFSPGEKINAKNHISRLFLSKEKDKIIAGLCSLRIVQLPGYSSQIVSLLYHADAAIAEEAAKTLYRTFSLHEKSLYKHLIQFLRHTKNITCRKWIIKTIAKVQDPAYLKRVILLADKLHTSEHRLIEEMVTQMGKQGTSILLSIAKNRTPSLTARTLAAKILGHRALHLLHANLEEIIEHELQRGAEIKSILVTFKTPESVQEKLLEKALVSSLNSYVEFIVQILSFAGEVKDPELVHRLWRENSTYIQSQLIETLEITCERKIFYKLLPLLEFSSDYERRERGARLPAINAKLQSELACSSLLTEKLAISLYYYLNNDIRWRETLPHIPGSHTTLVTIMES